MRRPLLTLFLAAAPLGAQATRASIGLPGWRDKFPIEDVTNAFTLDAPLGKAYAAVQAAFADLKVPINVDDPARRVIGLQYLKAQVSYAGFRMSRIFDCGTNGTGMQNADSYRVTMVFLALLDSTDATHTRLQLGIVGGGEPATGPTGAAVQCGSKGVLETRLFELASAHLKK